MIESISPASRSVAHVAGSDVVGLLQEMMDRLVDDFAFGSVTMVGEAPINRTTEPVVRFLLWLERTPEAQAALRLALKSLVGKPHLG
jgi:hypothetical protein